MRNAFLQETGTPLIGSKRVQFNMFVRKVNGVPYLDAVKVPRLVPILWLDEVSYNYCFLIYNCTLLNELFYTHILFFMTF